MKKIVRYNDSLKPAWDDFIAKSKNGTFLFQRDFMDYHKDRFDDFSLMFFEDETCVAVLPANAEGTEIVSHGGLTYGGLIMSVQLKITEVLNIFEDLRIFLKNEGFSSLLYKPSPYFYHRFPSEEDLYALFKYKSEFVYRHVSSVIDQNRIPAIKFSQLRIRGINKALKSGLKVTESTDIKGFWNILKENLEQKYQKQPVHSADELILLKSRFNPNIRLFTVNNPGNKIIAGVLVFEENHWVHMQYISSTEEGRKTGALDLLMHTLITEIFKTKHYVDFGHSCENNGEYLNGGLVAQKEGFGARTVLYDAYRIKL